MPWLEELNIKDQAVLVHIMFWVISYATREVEGATPIDGPLLNSKPYELHTDGAISGAIRCTIQQVVESES